MSLAANRSVNSLLVYCVPRSERNIAPGPGRRAPMAMCRASHYQCLMCLGHGPAHHLGDRSESSRDGAILRGFEAGITEVASVIV